MSLGFDATLEKGGLAVIVESFIDAASKRLYRFAVARSTYIHRHQGRNSA